jgi:hypothetical protein
LTADHWPATTTLSRDPVLTNKCVALPRLSEYGRYSHWVSFNFWMQSEKRVRQAWGFKIRKIWGGILCFHAHKWTNTCDSVRVTLSAAPAWEGFSSSLVVTGAGGAAEASALGASWRDCWQGPSCDLVPQLPFQTSKVLACEINEGRVGRPPDLRCHQGKDPGQRVADEATAIHTNVKPELHNNWQYFRVYIRQRPNIYYILYNYYILYII